MEKVITGFPNYMLDRNGNIFSRYKYKTSIVCDEWRPVQHVLDKGIGYYIVTLVNENERKNQFIHRLLAQHFLPNPRNKPQVNHIDGNKQNNCLSNLEWVTAKENAQHAARIGLCDARTLAQSVAVLQETLEGQLVSRHTSLHEAGRITGIAWQNISKVVRGIRPRAGGFVWRYE
jgi:hypothetical protein